MFGKIVISILFTTALYTTFSEVTNMSVQEALEKYEERVDGHQGFLLDGWLNKFRTEQSEEEKGKSNVIDLEQFPVKKVIATGYTAGVESTGKTEGDPSYGITYAGVPVVRDVISTIAADLDVFPLGTILYVPGYGLGVVADIGGAITGEKIDLYFETVREVYDEWGKREVDVYIVKEGEGSITEEELTGWNDGKVLDVLQASE